MIVTSGVTKGPLVTILAKRFGIRSTYDYVLYMYVKTRP
jgi:hypothetical protein